MVAFAPRRAAAHDRGKNRAPRHGIERRRDMAASGDGDDLTAREENKCSSGTQLMVGNSDPGSGISQQHPPVRARDGW
jgi:hypothetical protein